MKKILGTAILVFALLGGFITVCSTTTIDQGEVGVVWTAKSGVSKDTLSPGWHFVSPWAKVKKYPVAQQQIVFSNNPEDYNEKKHADWHIDAPANGGMVKLNVTVNYNFIAEKVTELYARFNGMDGETIVENRVQNSIIAYIKEVTPRFTVMDIYSDKRADVSKSITEYLNKKLTEEYGINVSSALIIDVQLDDTLMEKIRAKEQAKQDAEKAALDKKTAIARGEADKARAEANAAIKKVNAEADAEVKRVNAEADAKVKKINAEADAERTKIIADAQAYSNNQLSGSITSELIQMKEAEARLKHGWVTINGASTIVKQ